MGPLNGWFFKRLVPGSKVRGNRVSGAIVAVVLDGVLCVGGVDERFQIGGEGVSRTQRRPTRRCGDGELMCSPGQRRQETRDVRDGSELG